MSILDFFGKRDTIKYILNDLNDSLSGKRETALKKLDKLQISVDEGIRILDAAKNTFPPAKYEWQDISAQLIEICAKIPYVEYIDKIEAIYDDLNARAKISALTFLSTFENEKALIGYLKLLRKDFTGLQNIPLGSLSNKPRFAEILFPNLLSLTDNKEISSDIYLLLLTYFEKSLVNEKSLGQYKDTIIRDIVNVVKGINEYAFKEGITSIWDDDEYLVIRSKVGVHLDLAGYINDPEVIMALNSTMAMNDMRLKMFAALSLIKHGYELDDKDLMEIAADNEIRNWFYDGLQKIGRIDVFPIQYKTQQYFAESNMVDWLIYPTELARVPDKIELMSVFDDEEEEYYLFRFKCDSNKNWKEEGWMTGISGPFNKKAVPTTSAEGNTFSRFEKWESKTPEEHFEAIVGNVKQYWIKRAEELNG